ncbi:MAG: rod shape-determining protein MreC [Bacteroidales bacterium]|nr:rod shape-determining protein MreC [Bacteroidales bacterium]
MRELLRFLIKYHFILLFLILEITGIVFLVQNNTYQKAQFVTITHSLAGRCAQKFAIVRDYLSLYQENRQLTEENNNLYNMVKSLVSINYGDQVYGIDTVSRLKYVYIGSRVLNNSANKQFNYITLDKGKKDGIMPDMAVVCNEGIVGVVKEVSDNFSSVISFLNRNLKLSAKLKKTGHFGSLEWTGTGHTKASLKDIPHNINVKKGDTVVTSGYSAMFPEGYMIGVVSDVELKGGNYYDIRVLLSTDFKNLRNVQVVKNIYREEQLGLENKNGND